MKKLLPANLEVILVPIGLLVVLIILTIVAFKLGFSKISTQREEVAASAKTENILKTKEALLRQVGDIVVAYADTSSVAVPEDNPSLMVLAQLKNLAIAKTVTLDNLKVGAPGTKVSLSQVTLNFDVEGTTPAVLDYITSISNLSPLTTLDRVKISQSGGATRASLALEAYWAPFPKTLPELTKPLEALSSDEAQLLSKLSGLTQPPFAQIAPSGPSGRVDPFSF